MNPSRKHLSLLLLALSLLGCVHASPGIAAAPSAGLPKSFTATYAIKRNSLQIGVSQLALVPMGNDTYVYESITRASGLVALIVGDEIVERSKWTYADDYLRPMEYTYQRTGGRESRYVKLSFDWDKTIVSGTTDKDAWQLPLPPDAQDKNIYQLSLMRDLKAGRRSLEYHIIDGGIVKNYQFNVLGEEDIETALGTLHTIKLQRNNDVRNTTIWCAARFNYLPVLLKQTEPDGTQLSMHIKLATGLE